MERLEQDPEPGPVAVGAPVDEDGLRILLGRAHHELSTPLLTASGFSRIALDLVGGLPAGRRDTADELAATLARVVDGLERAHATLTATVALVEDRRFARLDLVEVLRHAADELGGRGTTIDFADLPTTIGCHGVPEALHELVVLLLELFTRERGGPAGAPTTIDVAASGAAHSKTVVVSLESRADPWPATVLAATEAPPTPATPAPSDGTGSATGRPVPSASLAIRAAGLSGTQLGRLWLDPDPRPGRRVATLRLLAGDRPPPDDVEHS